VSVALVIVHADSIDSVREQCIDLHGRWCSCVGTLTHRIERAIEIHRGPVIVVHQDWGGWYAEQILSAAKRKGGAEVIVHDEALDRRKDAGWPHYLNTLAKTMKRLGCQSAVLGGAWFDPEEGHGCVNATRNGLLQRGIHAAVNPDLVGVED
jgi:hypothetical protein